MAAHDHRSVSVSVTPTPAPTGHHVPPGEVQPATPTGAPGRDTRPTTVQRRHQLYRAARPLADLHRWYWRTTFVDGRPTGVVITETETGTGCRAVVIHRRCEQVWFVVLDEHGDEVVRHQGEVAEVVAMALAPCRHEKTEDRRWARDVHADVIHDLPRRPATLPGRSGVL